MERDAAVGLFESEDQHGVVDGELRETENVDDRRAAFLDLGDQVIGFVGDAGARERADHAPVAAVDVGLPGAAEGLFQGLFVRGAELAEALETGKNDASVFGTGLSLVAA